MMDHRDLNIFTDGSFYPNPRRGGIGMVFVFPESFKKEPLLISPKGYKKATNNQMELKACCMALSEILKFKKQWERIVIWTDSEYVCNYYKTAIFVWSKKNYKKSCGVPVSNYKLWKELLRNIQKVKVPVEIKWIKGHSKSKNNKRADKLAKQSAKKATQDPLLYEGSRRKKSTKETRIGSVKILGQKITIRIISGGPQRKGLYKYRFEVYSKKSPYYRNLDFIFYDKPLRLAHIFYVRLNKNQEFPKIIKIYRDTSKKSKVISKNRF